MGPPPPPGRDPSPNGSASQQPGPLSGQQYRSGVFKLQCAPFAVRGLVYARPMGWLISVESPRAARRPLYATVANAHDQARLQVLKYCSITNETIRGPKRILSDEEIKRLGLQPGEVKLYAT